MRSLRIKIHAEDTPLTVIVEPLGWDYTLAPKQSAWFIVETHDDSGYLAVSPGGERSLYLWLEGATSDDAPVLVDDVGEVQSGYNRALSAIEDDLEQWHWRPEWSPSWELTEAGGSSGVRAGPWANGDRLPRRE